MRRLGTVIVTGLLLMVVAVTPLSAITSGGEFETWVGGGSGTTRLRVTLLDHTSLVRGIGPAEHVVASTPRVLVLSWFGSCGDVRTRLTFDRTAEGYRVTEWSEYFGGPISIGCLHSVAMSLRTPVDPARVAFEAGEVR